MRTDPLSALAGVRPGLRISLRMETPDGPADRIGIILGLDDHELRLEDRAGQTHRIARASVRFARLVPTVARGRNPRHASPDMLRALAHDPGLAHDPERTPDRCWIARLCELVDHLDDTGVSTAPGEMDTRTRAARGDSRGSVHGEWAAARLMAAADLDPLAAWAARRNARNVVLTSSLDDETLRSLGLEPL